MKASLISKNLSFLSKSECVIIVSVMIGLVSSKSSNDLRVMPVTLPPCLMALSETTFIKPTFPPPKITSKFLLASNSPNSSAAFL